MDSTENLKIILSKYQEGIELSPEELLLLKEWMNSIDFLPDHELPGENSNNDGSASAFEKTEDPADGDKERSDEDLDELILDE